MKIIKSIIGILLLQTLSLFGDVKFDFVYVDEPGTGFHTRPEAKAALEEVGRLIGSNWLKRHNAKIIMTVISEENAGEPYLADVHPVEHLHDIYNDFQRYALVSKIIFDEADYNMPFDAVVRVNFHHPYSFGDKINANQFDFKSTLIHEITHALGFHSSSFQCPENEELLGDHLNDFVKKLFIYGINSIEGKADGKTLRKLVKKLDLLESANGDIDAQILNKAHSPLEVLQMGLVLEFKQALKNNTPLTVRSELYHQFSNNLAQKGMTIQEFIKFNNDQSYHLFMSKILLGFQDLSENTSDRINEKSLREVLITYDLLHNGFKDYVTHRFNTFINDLEEEEEQNLVTCLKDIILFYAQYLTTGTIDVKELKRINALINHNEIDVEEVASEILKQVNEYKSLEADIKSTEAYTFFDQFVTEKNGKKFFEGKVDDKITKSCFLKDGHREKQLYFSGPNALKYIGSAIPLNGMDASHISDERASIMNSAADFGIQSREWDADTTAIMLDLGYNVDNHWTRLWEHGKSEVKEFKRVHRTDSKTKKKTQKAQSKKSKKAKSAGKKDSLKTKSKKEAKKDKKSAKKAAKKAKKAAKKTAKQAKAAAKKRKASKSL